MRRSMVFCTVLVLSLALLPAGFAQDNGNDANKAKNSAATPGVKNPSKPAAAAPAPRAAAASQPVTPRVETFFGYSFLHVKPSAQTGSSPVNSFNMHGGSASLAVNLNRWLGLVADFGGYHGSDIAGSGTSGNLFSYLFGPRFSLRTNERVTPFAQMLLGGVHGTGSSTLGVTAKNAWAATFGGGMDINVNRRLAIRLGQAEYFMTRFKNIPGVKEAQNNLRLSSGIVFRWGSLTPPPPPPQPNRPPVAACSAQPGMVYAGSGDVVSVRAQASDPDGDPLGYTWSASGGSVDGTGSDVRWNSAGLAPGTYTVTARVDDGKGGTASCSADVRVEVKPNRPPVLSCSADRSTVLVGERVKIAGQGSDPDGDPLSYTWRTSGGQVVGSGANVELDTSGVAPGRYTVTGRAEDGRGGAADCSVGVEVQAPPPPPQASKINECLFTKGESARVDNVCKRILDDVALRLKNEPRATVVLVGYADPKERKAEALAGKRGGNVKEYIASKGVDATRMTVRTAGGQKGADKQNRRVDVIWVPEGATY
jgi:outer membrane protein OmpA-like peptidoglycan-associated protein